MNLRAKHFPIILLGAAIGAGLGRILSPLLTPQILPEFQRAVGPAQTGVVIGALVAAALTVFLLLFQSVRDPNAEPSRNFTSINGVGSTLIGKTDIAPDGSYLTTEWFIVLFIPIFPVCTYRVTERGRRTYTIHSKRLPSMAPALKVYGSEFALAAVAIAVVLLRSVLVGFIAVVAVLTFLIVAATYRRKVARNTGIIYTRNFCRSCGYRLTGNISGICPECGTPTPASSDPQHSTRS